MGGLYYTFVLLGIATSLAPAGACLLVNETFQTNVFKNWKVSATTIVAPSLTLLVLGPIWAFFLIGPVCLFGFLYWWSHEATQIYIKYYFVKNRPPVILVPDDAIDQIRRQYIAECAVANIPLPSEPIVKFIISFAKHLIQQEKKEATVPPFPVYLLNPDSPYYLGTSEELRRYRQRLDQFALFDIPHRPSSLFLTTITQALVRLTRALPPEVLRHSGSTESQSPFSIPLKTVVSIPKIVYDSVLPIIDRVKDNEYGLFSYFYDSTYSTNYSIFDSLVSALSSLQVSFDLPESVRFEHEWIIAPPGTGKTTLLSRLINADLVKVAKNQASIIVMDSQNELVPSIARLKAFAPGGPLEGRLVYIDCTDVDYPLALNLFDIGLSRLPSYSTLHREQMHNAVLSLLDYILTGLLRTEMTPHQTTLFQFSIQLLLKIPNATIRTFRELMQPGGEARHAQYVAQLDEDARAFFAHQFNAEQTKRTRQEVAARLYGVMRNRALARMFTAPQSKLDLFQEINSGKIILINAAHSLLQEEGVELVGRFFLALVAMAAAERATIAPEKRLPCFVYVDECHEIIANDTKITRILDQARKQKVGVILAHQRLAQLSEPVLDALYGSTAIKFASRISDAAAHALARNMKTTPEFIANQPRYSFAAYVRDMPAPVSLQISDFSFAKLERMTTQEQEALREQMRERYAHQPDFPEPEPMVLKAAEEASDPDSGPHTKPSTDY
jgi:hypothetical protein